MPWWARLFDGSHVVVYRARQGWALVIATMIMCLATFTGWLPLLWIGAIMLGAAYAGANLGWNLGHNDFASIGRAQHYMGVHVTLTGVRGAIAPPLGILFYEGTRGVSPRRRDATRCVLPLALTASARSVSISCDESCEMTLTDADEEDEGSCAKSAPARPRVFEPGGRWR